MQKRLCSDELRVQFHVTEEEDDEDEMDDSEAGMGGDVFADKSKIASFSLHTLPRPVPGGFLEMCDAVSQEMQETGCAFFDDQGHTRLKCHRDKPELRMGDFCYISHLSFQGAVSTQQKALAIRAILSALENDQCTSWGLCVYIPEAQTAQSREHDALLEAMRQDALPWLQAGFVQATELKERHNCVFIWASRSMVAGPLLSEDEASAMKLLGRTPSLIGEPTPLDLELRDAIQNMDSIQRAKELLAKGASLARSGVVHICAYNYATLGKHLETLLKVGNGDVNGLDDQNNTPLMVCAAAPFNSIQLDGIKLLLRLGANKDIRNPDGRTAFGLFRQTMQGMDDFRKAFGLPPPNAAEQRLVDEAMALLQPSQRNEADY